MENFKQKFIDTAYSKFGVKANESINFEQAFAIIDEIEQCNIANVVGRSEQLKAFLEWQQNNYTKPYDTPISEQLEDYKESL